MQTNYQHNIKFNNKQETYDILGAAFEVYKILRSGFSEYVYQDALEQELKLRNIPYEREKQIDIYYKGTRLSHKYIADFIVYGNVIIELKALCDITDTHRSQVFNYLKATNIKTALLLNFGKPDGLQYERIVY